MLFVLFVFLGEGGGGSVAIPPCRTLISLPKHLDELKKNFFKKKNNRRKKKEEEEEEEAAAVAADPEFGL